MSASAPAFRPVVKADGPGLVSGGLSCCSMYWRRTVMGCPADRPGEVGPGLQPARLPVVPPQFGELLPQPPGREALEGVHQPGQGKLRREVDRKSTRLN